MLCSYMEIFFIQDNCKLHIKIYILRQNFGHTAGAGSGAVSTKGLRAALAPQQIFFKRFSSHLLQYVIRKSLLQRQKRRKYF